MTFAPNARHSMTFAAGVSAGITITAPSPAAAAYAASAPPAFPAVGAASVFAPKCFACATATDIPRALNEPVGFNASSFTYRRFSPIAAPSRSADTSGVMPSPSVSGAQPGSTSAYRHRFFGRVRRFWCVSVRAACARS